MLAARDFSKLVCAFVLTFFSSQNPTLGAGSGFPLASCKGPNATLTSIINIDSANAIMKGTMKEPDIKEYCERMYQVGEPLRKCVLEMEPMIGHTFTAAANCKKRSITSLRNTKRETLELRVKGILKGQASGKDYEIPDWELRSLDSGQTFGYVCGYGTPPLIGQFQMLCPEESERMIVEAKNVPAIENSKTPENNSSDRNLSHIGKWYVQDPKECSLKPGESAELVSYTQDRVIGPEISCKILRTAQRGAATELTLMCDGEGRRGVRMKEVVQVANGRLQVGTDKYQRCP